MASDYEVEIQPLGVTVVEVGVQGQPGEPFDAARFDAPEADTLTGAEMLPGVQSGSNVKVLTSALAALAIGTLIASAGTPVGKFLRDDGSWANVALPALFDADSDGLVPASGGGTTNFLRADGTWANIPLFDPTTLADVALSGSYNDLSDIPSTFAPSAHTHAYSSLTGLPTLGTAAALNYGTLAGQVPVLGIGGKLDTSVLPSLAITDTFVVASQSAMLALSAERGDIAIRTDLNKSFVLSTDAPGTLGDWKELLTPTDAVLSVAGLTGAITGTALKTALAITYTDVAAPGADKQVLFNDGGTWGANAGLSFDKTTSRLTGGKLAISGNFALGPISSDAISANATGRFVLSGAAAEFSLVDRGITGPTYTEAAGNRFVFYVNGNRLRLYNGVADIADLDSTGAWSSVISSGNFWLKGTSGALAWGSTPDVWLYRDAANTLALRNGTNAQKLSVYETFTDLANYSRMYAKAVAGAAFEIGTEAAGTGTRRDLSINAPNVSVAGTSQLIGNVGLAGTVASPTRWVSISRTVANPAASETQIYIGGAFTTTTGGVTGQNAWGLHAVPTYVISGDGTGNFSQGAGMLLQPSVALTMATSGTVGFGSTIRGFRTNLILTGTGRINTWTGVDIFPIQASPTGTNSLEVVLGRGLYIDQMGAQTNMIVTSAVGAQIIEQIATTNSVNLLLGAGIPAGSWALYNSSTRDNAHAGKTRFGGVTAPVATVDVTGTIAAASGAVTVSTPVLNLTQTWNASTTQTFTATSTANVNQLSSATPTAGLAVGQLVTGTGILPGTFIAAINGTVITLSQRATASGAGVTFTAYTATGFTGILSNITDTASGASKLIDLQVGGVSKFSVSKDASAFFYGNLFEMRNGTSPQAMNFYNTFTDYNTFERLELGWDTTGFATIQTTKGSVGGSTRSLRIGTSIGTGLLLFNLNGSDKWYFANPGTGTTDFNFKPNGNLLHDIGDASNRVRNIYVGDIIHKPSASITPASNGDLVAEATSNTTLTFKFKGSDGVVRSGTVTLA